MSNLVGARWLLVGLALCAAPGVAEEPSRAEASVRGLQATIPVGRAWRAEQVFPAPEAVQAAAADLEVFFAISSTEIAKYDRRTGVRLAVSRGEATHLNSGFLWEGQLYCAHSNYPHKPERSEIKRLDPQTMRLTTFHDFGDAGGSLTWCLREADGWWCNFAYYGEENTRTYLARFDDDWRVLARYTYPREVIAELGRYSLSGGIFRHGDLLVTGHDDPVVFRLRLPEAAGELSVIDRQAVPFTGQGIALDPVTGGMVGIHRARRQVIFARPDIAP